MPSTLISHTLLKAHAQTLGFLACGVAPAHPVPPQVRQRYADWIARHCHASMHYLEQHAPLRFSPSELVPSARSVISVALSYHPGNSPTQPALAWYAQGKDYHRVLKGRLLQLQQLLQIQGRCFVDTAPVMEKYWAEQCGIGFVGKHTQLVIPGIGSAFFLGEIITDAECDVYDRPLTFTHHPCGTCSRCIEACPTQAIDGQTLHAGRCISYHTIESRETDLPDFVKPHLTPCFYGCDRCLRACPHLHAPQHPPITEFAASPQLLQMRAPQWAQLIEEQYQSLFQGSAVKRARFEGLQRNIKAAETL